MTLSLEPRPMSRVMFRRWRPRIERRTMVHWWGSRRFVVPRLVPFLWGDGRQWLWLSPINQRPAYYVLRIDSHIDPSSWSNENAFADTCLDSVLGEIALHYGEHCADDDRARWPEVDLTLGVEWGAYDPPRSTT